MSCPPFLSVLAPRQHALRGVAQIGEVQTEVAEDSDRDALAFVEQGEQQVGGADLHVAPPRRVVDGEAQDGLDARGRTALAHRRGAAASEDAPEYAAMAKPYGSYPPSMDTTASYTAAET